MLKLLRTNQYLYVTIVIVLLILLRISMFIDISSLPEEAYNETIFNRFFITSFQSEWASLLVSMILTIIQLCLVVSICLTHKVSNEMTLWPGLFFILILSLSDHFKTLNPALIANTFVCISFGHHSYVFWHEVFNTKDTKDPIVDKHQQAINEMKYCFKIGHTDFSRL